MSTDPSVVPGTRRLEGAHDYLAPDGSEIRLLVDVGGGGLAHCTLPPGGVSVAVRHQTVEELWYVLSGRGEMWRSQGGDEQVTELQAGVSLGIPCGTHFQFRASGPEPLRLLIATIPRWPGADEAVPVTPHWPAHYAS
jgi:mannose-6-phosphate isomerase-like protein (cupin superfamily)